MITKEQVIEAQNSWAEGIIEIGSLKDESKLNERVIDFLDELYSYESGPVLFKPTMASIEQFRNTKQMALSYFIGGTNSSCNEDNGFATKGWTKITYKFISKSIFNFNWIIIINLKIIIPHSNCPIFI